MSSIVVNFIEIVKSYTYNCEKLSTKANHPIIMGFGSKEKDAQHQQNQDNNISPQISDLHCVSQ